jgi:alginate O-acetyltransferase complex protein AlgI
LAFSSQIFCDFAGYSTCAIGVALCLGFYLPDNFRFPYAAIGFSDFWRRWHISLSTWLRDYLYIPLGGNRNSTVRTMINIAITMVLGGLWHGARWTFIVWGVLHALCLIAERIARSSGSSASYAAPRWALIRALATFAMINITWVFFCAETFTRAFTILGAMFGQTLATVPLLGKPHYLGSITIAGLLFAIHWYLRDTSLEAVVQRIPDWLRGAALAGMIIAIWLTPGEDIAFIYFQF